MAQLNNTLINGDLRVNGKIYGIITSADSATNASNLGSTAASDFALKNGNYSANGLVAKSASTAAYATSAGAAPVASHNHNYQLSGNGTALYISAGVNLKPNGNIAISTAANTINISAKDTTYSTLNGINTNEYNALTSTSANKRDPNAHQLSSHTNFTTYFNGTSANSALTSKSALSAGSASKAAELTNTAIKVKNAGTADYATSAGAAPFISHNHNYQLSGNGTALYISAGVNLKPNGNIAISTAANTINISAKDTTYSTLNSINSTEYKALTSTSANSRNPNAHQLSSHTNFSTYFNGTSANTALTAGYATQAGDLYKRSIGFSRTVAQGGNGKKWCRIASISRPNFTTASDWGSCEAELNIYTKSYGENNTVDRGKIVLYCSWGHASASTPTYSMKTNGSRGARWLYWKPQATSTSVSADSAVSAYTPFNGLKNVDIKIVATDTSVEWWLYNDVWDTTLEIIKIYSNNITLYGKDSPKTLGEFKTYLEDNRSQWDDYQGDGTYIDKALNAYGAYWVGKSDNRNYNVAFSLDNAFNYRNTLTFNPSSNTLSSTNITTVTLNGTTVKGATVSGTTVYGNTISAGKLTGTQFVLVSASATEANITAANAAGVNAINNPKLGFWNSAAQQKGYIVWTDYNAANVWSAAETAFYGNITDGFVLTSDQMNSMLISKNMSATNFKAAKISATNITGTVSGNLSGSAASALTSKSALTAGYAGSAGAAPVASHTHGMMSNSFGINLKADTSVSTWSGQFGVLNNGHWLYSIRGQNTAPSWFASNFAAGIAFGGADTKGVISVQYDKPTIKIAGGNGNSSAGAPVWWIGLNGTNGKTYTLPGADSTLVASTGSYSGTNGLTALSARGAYSATNASTAANATNAGTANVANAVNLTGEWTSNSSRYIWFGENTNVAHAGWDSSLRYNPNSDTLSSTNISSTSITGVTISGTTIIGDKGKFLSAEATTAIFNNTSSINLSGTNITATTFSGNLSGSAASALTSKSALTAGYASTTNTAIKVNSAIYLQDYSDSTKFVRLSWRSPDIKKVSTTGGQTSADTRYIAAWCVIDGSPVIKAVDVTSACVASADNADKVDGLHVATGTIGTATNYLYFC